MTNDHHNINTHDTDHHHIDARVRAAFEAETSTVVASDALLERIHLQAAEAPGDGRSARHGVWAAAAAVVVLVAALGAVSMGDDDGGAPVVAGLADSSSVASPSASSAPTVSVAANGLEPLEIRTSGLTPSESGRLSHTITIVNAGDEAIDIQEPRRTEALGTAEAIVSVGSNDCQAMSSAVPEEPVEADLDCLPLMQSLEPGDELSLDVTLLPAGEVTSDSLTWTIPIFRTVSREIESDLDLEIQRMGEIIVTYANLPDVTGPDPVTGGAPATPTTTTAPPTTTTAPPTTTTAQSTNATL